MDLTLQKAQEVMGASIALADRLGLAVCVAVCDPQGRLVAFSKMDGTGALEGHEAIRRAITSAGWGVPSEEAGTGGNKASTVASEGLGESRQPGGVPLMREGRCIGAVGVCGDAPSGREIECANGGRQFGSTRVVALAI